MLSKLAAALGAIALGAEAVWCGTRFGCVAKTNGSLVEPAKIPTIARPTYLVHEPQ